MKEKPAIVLQIDFKKKSRTLEKRPVKGLYLDPRTGRRIFRTKTIDGKDKQIRLHARTDKAAADEIQTKLTDHHRARLKIDHTVDPFARNQNLSFNQIASLWLAAGCPKRKHEPRAGKQLADSQARVATLIKTLGAKPHDQIDNDVLRAYYTQRTKAIRARYPQSADSPTLLRTGDRTVELEFDDLTSIYKWAQLHPARTGVTQIPFTRIRFRKGEQIRHCRKCQPRDGDEVDSYCSALASRFRSEPLAWQMQFQWYTGQRTHEILKLRIDAKSRSEPGFIEYKNRAGKRVAVRLWLYRSHTHKGTFPFWDLDDNSRAFLEAHRQWHLRRFPGSPHAIPNLRDPARPADPTALSKALASECELRDRRDADGKRVNITPHGSRSGYANFLRNQVNSDDTPKYEEAFVASRLGQKSDRNLIECYGERGDPISLLPTGPPWWSRWLPKKETQLELGL